MSPRGLVWNNATTLLKLLGERFDDAALSILEMSKNPKAHARFCALCCLGEKTNGDIVRTVIKAGVRDKSAKVRWKAVERARDLQLIELVPEITAALNTEKHGKTRSTIEFELRLLRDGYILEPENQNRYLLTVSYHRGTRMRYISDEKLKAEGIETLVAKLRKSRVPG